MIQTCGCSNTRVTNALSWRLRLENSAAVCTVGLTCRPSVVVTRSRTPNTSPYVTLSLMIIRSMSLVARSVALATEPYALPGGAESASGLPGAAQGGRLSRGEGPT